MGLFSFQRVAGTKTGCGKLYECLYLSSEMRNSISAWKIKFARNFLWVTKKLKTEQINLCI